ncbi:alcohol acetyltransferase [Stachybotrys elegans]|uniref:Alcohol acetyltransferase n=1 Tax=Stachybotrys elegans TaxID=80388 RepID=A0A8K0SJY4_9HYPO|nr:alcohol acetyltransferase [Stachybotrys elegans]
MSDTSPTPLRPLSHIERFSSTRHHLGIYRCVVVTCRYHASHPLTPSRLYAALAVLIRAHPMLRVGILNQHTSTPCFSHVPEVDLRNHLDFRPVETVASRDEYEAEVAKVQGWRHNQLWQDIETLPPWQLIVLTPPAGMFAQHTYDLVFGYHHSLADGTGGRVFHELLLTALNQPSQPPSSPHSLSFPTPPLLPEAQQDVIDYKSSPTFVLGAIWSSMAPAWLQPPKQPIWHGRHIDYSLPYITRVSPVDIDADTLSSLLKACRRHSTSLTGLLHALALTSLSLHLPAADAPAFVSATPINARPYLSPSANPDLLHTLRVLISSQSHSHSSSVVAAFRDPAADLDALIWSNAQRIKNELTERASTLPLDDPISLTRYISDWFAYWRKKDGQPREDSWEISNIGAIKEPGTDTAISRILFTNGAMVAGPAIGLNVGSVAGHGLTIAISWQDAIVPDSVIQQLSSDFAAFTTRFHKTGKFMP